MFWSCMLRNSVDVNQPDPRDVVSLIVSDIWRTPAFMLDVHHILLHEIVLDGKNKASWPILNWIFQNTPSEIGRFNQATDSPHCNCAKPFSLAWRSVCGQCAHRSEWASSSWQQQFWTSIEQPRFNLCYAKRRCSYVVGK